jgi:hypothetical protein
LQLNGSELNGPISDGPIVCQQDSTNQCYRPAAADILHITPTQSTDAAITVSGSPLSLAINGSTGSLTINNTSSNVTATNIKSDFTGTALEGYVTETGNTCTSVTPGSSCTLTYTPGGTVVSLTSFTIKGDNTNSATGQIAIYVAVLDSGTTNGGTTSVTLVGSGLNAIWSGSLPAVSYSSTGQSSCTSGTVYTVFANINLDYGTTGQTNTGWAPNNSATDIFYTRCLRLCTNFSSTNCTNGILVS